MRAKFVLFAISIMVIAISGCVDEEKKEGPTPTESPEIIQTPSPTVVPTDDTEIRQKLTDMAKENLSQMLNIRKEDIKVVKIEDASWPDSSMGYGKPNQSYLPVEVIGYKIFLQYKDTTYEYHGGNERVVAPPDIR